MAGEWDQEQATFIQTEARDKADSEYKAAMLRNEGERIALEKAKQAWLEVYQKAGLTGMYEGGYTMPVQQWQSEKFGTWGAPTQGQQTLEAQQQAWKQAYEQAAQYGQWYAPGSTPTQGQQTMAQQQQQWAQNLQAIQEARAAQGQQQTQAMSYLNLLKDLRGPADWAKYQQVLGATPNGMRDLTAAAMGQYIPGGGATTGVGPDAASLQSMQQQISGGGANTMGAGSTPGATPDGTGGMGNLPAPNQIAPQAWRNLAPSQQQMLLGSYEAQGWHKPDVEALFSQSLPKYAANAPGAGTFRLR